MSPRTGTLVLVALLLAGCLREPQRDVLARGNAGSPGEWPSYGHDAGGSRYSPLTAIDRANVHHSQPLRNV